MAGKTDDLIDDDAAGLPDGEDDLTATLRQEMDKISSDDDSEDDSGGFDAPLDESEIEPRSTVDEEEGVKRVQDARDKATSAALKKADEETPKAKEPTPDKGEKTAEDKAPADDDKKPETVSVSDEDYNTAIGALSEPVQTRIKAEREQYQSVMAPFKGREAELAHLGIEPKDAVAYFVNVNDYAQRDPSGYTAWVIGQTTSGDAAKAEAVLKGAAEKLGYTIAKATGDADPEADDDDPFMSDRERELLKENRSLKASQTAPAENYGPDSQQERGRRAVMDVISEVGPDGNALRPNFEMLQPTILSIVKANVAATGKPMTSEMLAQAYEQAELAHPETREAATDRLIASRSAAQTVPDVAQQQKNAAALAKSKAASTKIIDGPGQGANRQPASEDADLGIEAFLKSRMSGSS